MSKTVTDHDPPIERLEAALDHHEAQVDQLCVASSRRLTGPSLIWDRPGAVIDIDVKDIDAERLTTFWDGHARRVLDAIGWVDQKLTSRRFHGGVTLALSAPKDQLHSSVLAARIAWHYCAADLLNTRSLAFDDLIGDLKSAMAQEADPTLIALIDKAELQGVDILCDDDEVSIGHGIGSQTWSVDDLPSPQDVTWSHLHDIPLALITGTNGKTTTTRLCAAIALTAGMVTGLTTTDVVQVGDDILDRGDYSGPGGARMLLRDPRVQIAFLEAARGGILRRGLPTRRARVAVVTNIARDHLGEYGVTTVAELADAKFAVTRALVPDGVSVLNADDACVVHAASDVASAICWFSLDPAAPQITQARASGQACAYLERGMVIFFDGNTEALSIPVKDIPITLGGAARHNIGNALAAICACRALGIPHEAIRDGLCGFASDPMDNPGRFNEVCYNGARLFIDYAHNPAAIAAVCNALAQVPAQKRIVMISQPGDRSDQDIHDATTTALQFQPDLIVVAEIADYLRGRKLNETTQLIETSAISSGINPDSILRASSPSEGTKLILAQLQPRDLVLLLVLSDRERVFDLVQER